MAKHQAVILQPQDGKELILLGNSPFLNQIDIPRLLELYYCVGFNGLGQHYPVAAVFCFDRWIDPGRAGAVYHPAHIMPPKGCANSHPFAYQAGGKPIITAESRDGLPLYTFRYFSPSVALNWAIREGFSRAYLVGIDHVETDTRFAHHDGAGCKSELTVEAHQAFKRYVGECAKYIEIFQTNPTVRKGWDLPFKEIQTLYEPKQ